MTRFCHGYNLAANGIRQHLLRYGGAGETLLLLPGITSPAVTWGFVAERLARHFDVHVLDYRGRGLSETREGMDYSLDAMAADALAIMESCGWRDVTVLGHSMGARVAIRAARIDPSRMARLLLLDPPVTGPGRRPYPAPLSWYVDSIRLMRAGAGLEALRPFSPTWSDAHLRLRAEWLHTCDETAIVQAYDGFHTDDVHADFAAVRLPGLLMLAGRGGVVLPQDRDELARLAPGLTQVVAAGAGHMIPWDDEEDFFRLLGEYLGRDFPG
jgi:N-formylmaleamate deformylase